MTADIRRDAGFAPNAAHLLWRAAEARPGQPAVVSPSGDATYAELRDRAAGVAALLAREGVARGDRVGILLERGPSAAAAFFGVLATGAIAIHVNESLRARQVEHILSHAGAKLLLTAPEPLERLGRPLRTDARVHADNVAPSSFDPVPCIGADPALLVYTSGSTGMPKGVLVSHGNIWAGAQAVAAYTGLAASDRIASLLPFSFDYGLNQLLTSTYVGATLVVETSPMAADIVRVLRERAVTVLPCVPPLWLQLLSVPSFRTALPDLRVMTNTGGRLPVDAVRALRAAHPQARLFLMYGLTEAFRSTFLPPEEVDAHPDSIGRAIPGAQIMVLTPELREAAAGEEGELVHRGPTVALGYWNDPAATTAMFRPNPLRPPGTPEAERVVFSGDLVRRDAEGRLYHLGRRDAMIKTMGYRVSPDEIASVLYGSGQIEEAIVTTEPDPERGSRIIAHVVLAAHGTLEALRRFIGVELPRYMQPARVEVHDTLPRTASGKHDAAALRPSPRE